MRFDESCHINMEDVMASRYPELLSGVLRSAELYPARPAIEVAGETYTYERLLQEARSIAGVLSRTDGGSHCAHAVFAARSLSAYAGVLGALLTGCAYVPLNPRFPATRNRAMLHRSGARSIVVDATSENQLGEILSDMNSPIVVILPHKDDLRQLARAWPKHVFAGREAIANATHGDPEKRMFDSDPLAYILFTSGSTGTPKGCMVTQANVLAFISAAGARYGIVPEDRLSQMFDLTFDLSAFDMFMAWGAGACLCVPSASELLAPAAFINRSQLTVWFSVPSTAAIMKRLGQLKTGAFPSLRWSLFCGEALPTALARQWQAAAPYSIVENLYGPTEMTIACTVHRLDDPAGVSCNSDLMPIGRPLAGTQVIIVNEELEEVEDDHPGELLATGKQLSRGYLGDDEKTRVAFVHVRGREALYYRTGDVVRRDEHGVLHFMGRVDGQIKISGYRVELGEVESAVRALASGLQVAAVGWPKTASGVGGIVCFVEGNGVDIAELERGVRERLPDYMVPRRYIAIDALPLNQNGKVDRKSLFSMLESGLWTA